MTLNDIYTILKATGFPVAYSHFTATPNNPLPTPPYICYLSAYSSNFAADNKVYKEIDNLQIELYTVKKDLAAEKKIKDLLDENEIAYNSTETWIEDEKVFQKIYEVRLI
ncbi:hypothetical protein [Clostridium neonatale]|uniref:hypothetical protein n=1 Tax=Clostridium neonatale TaxID=137838 RepID=UPI00291BF2E3|nr:hypothetical protein [Clostridium neonatale]CAI3193100.1 conserved hypothetical protein [Clostridium neonatale]CAI3196981.1 conserved hypothetical protein [Clostridium neonatale]